MDKYLKKAISCHNRVVKATLLPDNILITDISGGMMATLGKALTAINNNVAYDHPEEHIQDERIVDYISYNVGRISAMNPERITFFKYNHIFGKNSIDMFLESPHGSRFFVRRFLASSSLSKDELMLLIIDRNLHPLSKYVFVKSEEQSKRRFLNERAGFLICQKTTTLFSPLSKSCLQCNFKDECKIKLKDKNQELYRLRKEIDNE